MRVEKFSAHFLKARKIGTLKSFTLSCNARIQLRQKIPIIPNQPICPKFKEIFKHYKCI